MAEDVIGLPQQLVSDVLGIAAAIDIALDQFAQLFGKVLHLTDQTAPKLRGVRRCLSTTRPTVFALL